MVWALRRYRRFETRLRRWRCPAGLFEDPTFSVGMIGWFSWGAMNLAWTVEYVVQTRRARTVPFEWLFPLTGLRATESGIDSRVFGVIAVVVALVSVATWLAVAVSGLRCARVACCVVVTGQPAILARAEAGHDCHEGCHGLWLLLAEMSGEPLITDVVFKGR